MNDTSGHLDHTSTNQDGMDANPSAANATGAQSGSDSINKEGLTSRGPSTSQVSFILMLWPANGHRKLIICRVTSLQCNTQRPLIANSHKTSQ